MLFSCKMKWRMPIQFRNRPLSPAVQNSKEQAARSRLQRVAACTPHATPTCDETNGPCERVYAPLRGHVTCVLRGTCPVCPFRVSRPPPPHPGSWMTPPSLAPRPEPCTTSCRLLSPCALVQRLLCVRTTIRIPQQYRVVGPAPRARSPLRGGPACAPGS